MLRLLRPTETIDVDVGGTTFTLRLQSHSAARALRIKHTKRGRLDEEAMAAEFWKDHLVGWKSLADASGKPVEFHASRVLEVVDALPDDVIALLTVRAREPQFATAEALQG